MSIITSVDNPLTDDDYYGLLSFCKVVCSSVPVMEEDEYVRKRLEDKADAFDELNFAPEKKKGKESTRLGRMSFLQYCPMLVVFLSYSLFQHRS